MTGARLVEGVQAAVCAVAACAAMQVAAARPPSPWRAPGSEQTTLVKISPLSSPPTLLTPTQEEFLENLHQAAAALQRVLPRVVEFIAGKRLSEL